MLRKCRRMLRIGPGEPAQWPDEFRSSGLRAVAQAYIGSDAFPDRVFDRKAMQSLVERHFDHGENRLDEVGVLLTLASASRLLVGNLRSVPAEVQPDLSTSVVAGPIGGRATARAAHRYGHRGQAPL